MSLEPITYTQSAASQEVAPPYHFPKAEVHAFVWEASMPQIRDYCDTFLNLDSEEKQGFVYEPAALWPYNLLLFIHYPQMISSKVEDPKEQGSEEEVSYGDRGYITQTEVFVAMPVVRRPARRKRLLFDTAFEWAVPLILVSNGMSAVAGREMIGMPKLLADIKTPESRYPGSFEASVHLPGWASAEAQQSWDLFLKVKTAPVLPTFRGHPPQSSLWTLLQGRVGDLLMSGVGVGLEMVDAATYGLLPTAMRTVSLRQYRDARDTERAVYQALVTCRAKYTNVSNFEFYNEKDVVLAFQDKGSFGEILRYFLDIPEGSAEAPTGHTFNVEPQAAFRFNADIDFDDMRTIHTFAIEGGHGLAATATSDLAASWTRPWRAFFGPRPS